MRFQKNQFTRSLRLSWASMPRAALYLILAALVMIPVVSKALLQNQPRNVPEFLNRQPDANDQEKMRQQQQTQQNFAAANAERKKKIAAESAELLKLATDLKAELDATSKDTLSLSAIRKTESIEKLAKSLKQEMKLTMGPN